MRKSPDLKQLAVFIFSSVLGLYSYAGSVSPITYQGRILKPDGRSLEAITNFRFTIKAPNDCILWQEDKTIDMTGSKGALSALVGSGTNSAAGSHTFSDVFNNSYSFTGLTGCGAGSTFTPGLDDDRTLFVSFNDGSGTNDVPAMDIKNVPYSKFAAYAQDALGVFGKAFGGAAPTTNGQILVYNSAGAGRWEVGAPAGGGTVTSVGLSLGGGLFSVTGSPVTTFGTLTATLAAQAQNTVFAGPSTGGPGAPVFRTLGTLDIPNLDASKITSGTLATSVIGNVPGANGGTVTQVNTGVGLVGGPFSTVGTISLNTSGVTAGSYGSGTYIPTFTVDQYGRLTTAGSTAILASQWSNIALGINYASGSVGIGVVSPAVSLDINGAIKIANDTAVCAAGFAGAIRYNGASLQFCDGVGPAWITLGVSGAGMQSLNGLVANNQGFAIGSSGTLAAFSSVGTLHTLNIPMASTAGAVGGLLSNADYLSLTTGTFASSRIGILPNANGGTGLDTSTASNGQLLIGNGAGFSLGTLGMANGIVINNAAGTIQISSNAQTANTINTIVTRDGSGNFDAGQVTASSLRLNNAGAYVTISNPIGSNYSFVLPANMGSSGQFLRTNGTSATSWSSLSGSDITSGTLNTAQLGTIDGSSLTNIAGTSITSGTINWAILGSLPSNQLVGTLAYAQIGNLDASLTTSGTFGLARLGNLPFTQVAGTISVAQVGVLDGSQVSAGTLNTSVVGSLPFTSLSGTVSLAQRGPIDGSSLTNIAGTSITSGTINWAILGSLPSNQLAGTLNTSVVGQLPFTSVTGTISTAQVGVLDASQVGAGTLNLAQIGNLPASQVTSGSFAVARIPALNASILTSGTVNTAQLGTIDGSSLTNIAGSSITSGTINWAILGSLPSNQLAGTLAYAQLGNFDASLTTSGTFGLARLGNLPFTQVTGTISVAQVGVLNGSQVTAGTLNTSVVGNLPFTSLSGTISTAQLGTIDGSSLTNIAGTSITSGTINWAILGSLPSSQLAGTLNTSVVGALPFTSMTGTISTAQIGAIDASQVTSGSFAAARIPFLNASILTSGTLNTAQIGAIDGSAITSIAGTSITSGTINWAIFGSLPSNQLVGTLAYAQLGSLEASLTTSGTFDLARLGNLPFTQVSGTISVAQVGILNGSQVSAGTLNTSVIGNLPFTLLTGTISTAQMGTINGSSITNIAGTSITSGTINWAILGQLPSAQLAGTINTSNIGNLPFTSLNGTISTAQVGAIPFTSLSGTNSVAQIGVLNGSQVSVGTLNTSVIGNLPFTSLNGTISTAQLGTVDGSSLTNIAGTSITSGTINWAILGQLPSAQLSGTLAYAQIGNLDASLTTSGTFGLARLGAVPFSQLNGTISVAQVGILNGSQVSAGTINTSVVGNLPFTSLTGTISTAQMGTINGSSITNIAGTSITSGTINWAILGQLPSSQLSGTVAYAQLGSFDASLTTSGTFGLGRLGAVPFSQLNGTISFAQVGTLNGSLVGAGTLNTSVIGTLPFTSLTGTISTAQLGTINGSSITNIAGTSITSGTINWAILGQLPSSQLSGTVAYAQLGTIQFSQVAGTISTAQRGPITISGGTLLVADGSVAAPSYSFAADTGTGFYRLGTSTIGISTGGTLRMAFDNSGNVGIGTTTPSAALTVFEGGGIRSVGHYITAADSFDNSRVLIGAGAGGNIQMYDNGGALRHSINTSGATYFTSGSVGIGTTTPLALLDVAGATRSTSNVLAGAGTMTLLPPTAGNLSLRFPSSSGVSGQVLALNGLGTLGWTTVPVSGGTFLAANGSVGTPSISFLADPDTGFYNAAGDEIGVTIAGSNAANLNNTAWNIYRVVRSDNGSVGSPHFSFNLDSDTGFYSYGSNTNQVGIVTGGTIRMSVDGTGNVGIGTSSPSGIFSVGSSVGQDAYLFYDNSNVGDANDGQSLHIYRRAAEGDVSLRLFNDQFRQSNIVGSTNTFISTTEAGSGLYLQWGGRTTWFGGAANVLGSVGIGMNSPNAQLEVETSYSAETVRLTNTNANSFNVINFRRSNNTQGGWMGWANATGDWAENSMYMEAANSPIVFATNGSATVKIFSDGNMGIGTTAVSAGNRLEINGGAIAAGNQGEFRMMEGIGNGTNSVALRAPAALTANYRLTLPTTTGSAGWSLITDGSGQLSWGTTAGGGGGSSQWTDVALGINYSAGSVGIGTSSPNSMFTVNKSTNSIANYDMTADVRTVYETPGNDNDPATGLFSFMNLRGNFDNNSNETSALKGQVTVEGSGNKGSPSAIWGYAESFGAAGGTIIGVKAESVRNSTADSSVNGMLSTATNGNASGQVAALSAGTYEAVNTGSTTDGFGVRSFYTNTGGITSSAFGVRTQVTASGGTNSSAYGLYVGDVQGAQKWSIFTSDALAPSYFAGSVGVGTTNPTSKLEVQGGNDTFLTVTDTGPDQLSWPAFRLNSTGFTGAEYPLGGLHFMNSNNTRAQVMAYHGASTNSGVLDFDTSDGSGVLQNRMRIDDAGNVGIGTTGPVALLDVNGTTKLGAAGVAVTNMGACTVATQTYTANTPRNGTCTGMPATAAVAVNCSPGAALSAAGTVLARSTGAGNQVAITLSSTVTTVVMYCMWIQP